MSDNTGLVERLREPSAGRREGECQGCRDALCEEAADRIQAQEAQIGEMHHDFGEELHAVQVALQSSEARALAAEGETLRLREALKPFARFALCCADDYPDDYILDQVWREDGPEDEAYVTMGDCRKARSLLSTPLIVGLGADAPPA